MSDPVPVPPPFLHERPELGLTRGARVCECDPCRRAVVTGGVVPTVPAFVVTTERDVLVVDATLLAEALRGPGLPWLLYVPADAVVEVAVADDRGPLGDGPQRWWSWACAEDDQRLRRQGCRWRLPRRQSMEAQRSREPGWVDRRSRWDPPPVPPTPGLGLEIGLDAALAGEVERHADVLRLVEGWAARRGEGVHRPLLALVLALLADAPAVPLVPSADTVHEAMSWRLISWVARRDLDVPVGIEGALQQYVRFLGAHDLLADPPGVLAAAATEVRDAAWDQAPAWPDDTDDRHDGRGRILPWTGSICEDGAADRSAWSGLPS